jgi:hypothetical protein
MNKRTSSHSYDLAILGAAYDGDTVAQLTGRLRDRLGESRMWTRSSENGDAMSAEVACEGARTVLVLQDRLWGTTDATSEDRAVVDGKLAKGDATSVIFLSLDGSKAPAGARKAKSLSVRDVSIDDCVESIVAIVQKNGAQPEDATADRTATDERYARDRDSYLGSHRSGPACSRELERLVDEVVERVETLRDVVEGEIVVTRGVGRSIIQLGPSALTISWIRSRTDSAIEGRLMLMEWDGIIRRGNDTIPERAPMRSQTLPPTLLHEEVFVADASTEQNWRWRREGCALGSYTSSALADRCLASLSTRLGERPLQASA